MFDFPKFLVATNPMADPEAEYIYHTQKPRFLAKFTPEDPLSHFQIVDEIDNFVEFYGGDAARAASKIAGLMRRMGDWWVAYCNWEENNAPPGFGWDNEEDDEN
jgi:hypothetical protein